jgi:hypothetical protein
MTDLARRESEFLLYTAPDGAVKVAVLFRDETAWLTQKALAELFGVGVPAINKHLKNIFESGELEPGQLFPKWKWFETREAGRSRARSNSTASTRSSRCALAVDYSRRRLRNVEI